MIFDLLANVPIITYGMTIGFPRSEEEIEQSRTDTWFRICLGMKLIRITHGIKVKTTLTYLLDKLSGFLHWKKYQLENILKWSKALYTFLLGLNILACGWVLIHTVKISNGDVDYYEFKHDESDIKRYFEALYLVTSTISTVGYGDIKGFMSNDGVWLTELSYLSVTIFLGILLFTVLTNEIFNYKKILTLNEMV